MPRVTAPVTTDSSPEPAAAQGDFSPGGKKFTVRRLLVVDDEPLIRWSVAETFGEIGHEVQVAGTAAQALQAVSSSVPFDTVLLDLRLPDSTDLGLLDRLRAALPAARIILMTAYGTPELIQRALASGASCVLNKPFELNDVLALVG